ncbi:hypothetical protein [Burkholderia pseudomallei]|uniref:hypothetical protein n=1 Tax=Burkholderia pseudomallei TaxID=28450 RepID=UPI001DF80F3D|nr:hypothetical protein [Burkholderia pseudomallei]MPT99531.1 hypothetical protein [Burkholderia pseudomallei]
MGEPVADGRRRWSARAAPELSVDKITTVQARAKRRARRNADARRCGAVFIRRRTAALWRSDDGATPRDCSILSASIFPEPP